MNRYLLRISYIGTHFKAFTKAINNGVEANPTTVGVIEEALQKLKPKNIINVRTISRTDSGVHALNSAVLVDLERKNGKPYDCYRMTSLLNDIFEDESYQLRVNQTDIVPNTFNEHTNAVKSRTYLYRIGIIKKGLNIDWKLEEKHRCFFMYSDNFDVQRFQEAAQMFVGKHDFRTFMAINNDAQKKPSFSIRTINYVKIERSQARTVLPFEHNDNVQYYDVIINAQSFLYRQIRRIVGTLIAVAVRRMSQRELYEMLTIPSQESFTSRVNVVPAHGLYLADIEFRENCFINQIQSGK